MDNPAKSLNYSLQSVQALASQAEMMVRSNSAGENGYRKDSNEGDSEDSDYQSRIHRDSVISSELIIPQRQLIPTRKFCKRYDFRQSLPDYLDYFQPSGLSTNACLLSPGGIKNKLFLHKVSSSELSSSAASGSQNSLSLSELWEQVN